MKIHQLKFQYIPQLSETDVAYQSEDPRLRPFYRQFPKIEAFATQIQQRQFSIEQRTTLVELFEAQYKGLDTHSKALQNIQKLGKPHSYTITTAHQPSLLTGPLYFIYKICSVINLTTQLNKHYPQYDFVPVYWMGGEDHDFEEVNHLHLFGKTLTWEDEQGGSVGRYDTKSLQPLLQELEEILGDGEAAVLLKTYLKEAFTSGLSYAESLFRFIHRLFERYGLLILIPDAVALKSQMQAIFKDDLLEHHSKTLVEETVTQLEKLGFKNQAYVRAINLFYLQAHQRLRIEKDGGLYKVLETDIEWTREELLKELELHPERFSPNVILRPLFQEMVLPNLAYIGGGGELAYWLERKAQFEHYQIPYPILIRRNSVQFVDANSQKKLQKLNINSTEIFKDKDQLIREFIEHKVDATLSFESEQEAISAIFEQIKAKTAEIEPTLEASVGAQEAQLIKGLQKLEGRLLRAEKRKEDVAVSQIRKLKAKLLPQDGLQERHDNFIPWFLRYGTDWIDFLVKNLDPLNPHFLLIEEE